MTARSPDPTAGDATSPNTRCCLDAMVCIILAGIGRLDLLPRLFGPQIYVPRRVFEEWHGTTETGGAVDQAPSVEIVEPAPVDGPVVARLHRRFGSVPPRNDGEAQLLAVCKRTGYVAITEDKQGWVAARDEGVSRAYMVTVLACAAGQGRLNPTDAWRLHVVIEKWRQSKSPDRMRFSVMPYYEDYPSVFMQVHAAFRKRWIDAGRPPWCDFLVTPQLDEAIVLAVRRAR